MLDTSHYRKRREREMEDPAFATNYARARAEIAQVDAVMRQLDTLREESGVTKTELARLIDRNPSTVRRLFTAEVNPELKTVAAIASALGARVEIVSDEPPRRAAKKSSKARSVA